MGRSAGELFEKAMRLDPKERATLMRLPIDTLDAEAEEGSEGAWRAEVQRRIAELGAGAVDTVPWGELRARLQQR
jgi:putative addiction module component (TIGR02574 family)